MYHLTRCLVLGHNNCIILEGTYNPFIPWYEFDLAPNGALRHVESTPQPLAFYKLADAPASLSNLADYYFASVSGGKPAGGGANAWDYISNGASVASGYPTISGTWAYNNSRGDIRWTGKN